MTEPTPQTGEWLDGGPRHEPERDEAAERARRAVEEADEAGGPGAAERPPRGARQGDGQPEPGADGQEPYPD